ncbi:MAG: NTP transferase domain-containing protein [Candidatus Velthaea sp.]
MYAVITAGGRAGAEFAAATGTDIKALAPLGARRLIDPVIEAAAACGVQGIAVIAGPEVAAHCRGRVDRIIEAADDGVENIRRALHAFEAAPGLLYLTCDLPFVTGAALAEFAGRAAGAAVAMALANADAYETQFPGAPPHGVALGGERVANGSAFVIAREAVAPLEAVAGRFFTARKSLIRLALLLGPALCWRFACRRLDIATVEARARRVLGVDVRAVRDAAPGLCYDVDDVADWAYAHSFALAGA